MKLGMVITQTDPETVFNALRLALYSLQLRHSEGSEICPLSTLKDHYEVVRDADRLVTV
jgi:hypothetical protein